MKFISNRFTIISGLLFLFIFITICISGVHSIHPYNPDPAIAANDKKSDEINKKPNELNLTGDALRDHVLADPTSIKNGELRFAQNCSAYCHGDKGAGGEVHPLQCQPEYDGAYLFAIISEGRRSGSRYMPPWKDTFSEKERWELAAFILSLQNLPKCKE